MIVLEWLSFESVAVKLVGASDEIRGAFNKHSSLGTRLFQNIFQLLFEALLLLLDNASQ